MKLCNKCKTNKEPLNFSKKARSKDGLSNWCKDCNKDYTKSYYINNKESLDRKNKENYQKNSEHFKQKSKEYRENNKEYYSEYFKVYYSNNKESLSEYKKNHYNSNRDKYLINSKQQKESNPEKYSEYLKNWRENYTEYMKGYLKEWWSLNRNKRKTYWENIRNNNPHYIAWRSSLRLALSRMNKAKNEHTIDLLGYTPFDLKSHMESLFKDGMSWENWGEWHIDHKIPVSKFDPNTPIDVVNDLSNLQPLWAFENLSKSNKI